MEFKLVLFVFTIFAFTGPGKAQWRGGQRNGQNFYVKGCDEQSCYPATGNLLIGRGDKLEATDTCGMGSEPERYCIISSLDSQQHTKNTKCAMCDARNPENAHNVSAIVHKAEPPGVPRSEQKLTWWQGTNGKVNTSITLNLEAEFHVTHVIITFKTFRPAAMFIEKSFDWGKTWTIHRYFSSDCRKDFPGVPIGVPAYLNQTVCQGRYSRIAPSTNGEVIYRVLPPNINLHSVNFEPYSEEVQDLIKTTNLRMTFTRLHTLGDENLLDDQDNVKEKYYFSIYSMVVRGSCSCYGHASKCVHAEERHRDIPGMVHGTCKCEHNTMGDNCEHCKPFYQDWPWRPGFGKKKNECKMCNCNEHTDKCHFDDRVYSASGKTSGGVCDDCQHNTEGRNCEDCIPGFYQDPAKLITDPDVCAPCDCYEEGTVDWGMCDGKTRPEDGMVAGQCHCKTHVGGVRCDRCAAGYWNFTSENPDGCQQCTCNPEGTVQSADGGCDEVTGACRCKRNVAMVRDCDQCLPQHYGLSQSDPQGCKACDCDPGGAYNNNCDVNTGQCLCRPNLQGRRCDQVVDFFYTGPFDYLLFEGELATGSENPPTMVIKKKPSEVPGQTAWTGFGYMQVFEGSSLKFHIPDVWRTMNYFPIIRYQHDPSNPTDWDRVTMELIRMYGAADPTGVCSDAIDTQQVTLVSGPRHTEQEQPFCLEAGQRYEVKLTFNQWAPDSPTPSAKILIDSITMLPDIRDIPFLNRPQPQTGRGRSPILPMLPILPILPLPSETPGVQINGVCPPGQYPCLDRVTCYTEEQKCDGHSNCPQSESTTGGEDEEDCTSGDGEETEGSGLVEAEGDDWDPTEPWLHPSYITDLFESNVSTKGWYPGQDKARYMRSEFDRLQCARHFLRPRPSRMEYDVPEDCMEILRSISFLTFQGAHMRECDCHETGSNSGMCDKYYGDCSCKNLVVGRRCNSCAPAAYGFSGSGCLRCECHNRGSQDEFCNQTTGQCSCNTLQPTFGRKCDECKPGYFGFPDCRQCVCNLHAETCHPQTGACNHCRDNTMGDFCDKCMIGYYGRPYGSWEDQVQCKECMCPDTKASGHSFAWDNTCELDPVTMQSVCHCEDGYTGDKCDMCMDNFFGHPEIPGGTCQRCDCSQNWIESEEGNCHHHTGECLKCVYETTGFNCEHCKDGWYGDAVNYQCRECACDPLGTDSERFACDRKTGQCHCLPNVEGFYCSECIENHWKIASGLGCEPCDCDVMGSTGPSCFLYTGQCDCKPGYGGRRCDECEVDMWGDPQEKCIPCNCNKLGVNPDHTQCDTTTGKCHCLEGIGGEKCDECAPGFIHKMPITPEHPVNTREIPPGHTPNCQRCGECFDNWNRILEELQSNTTLRVAEAETVKITGAAGAYTARFNSMESSIEEVNNIISRSSIKNEELEKFTDSISSIEAELEATTGRSKELDDSLAQTEQSINQGKFNLTQLRADADRLQRQAENIKDKATQLQEANVAGALELTGAAAGKSDQAQRLVSMITGQDGVLHESDKIRRATEVLLAENLQQGIANTTNTNTADLEEVNNEIRRLEERIPRLNKDVCDGVTTVEDPCDDLCGGAGCGKCGDVSCGEGALTKAQDAVTDAKEAEKTLKEKNLQAEEALNSINSVHNAVISSADLAQVAYDRSNEAKNRSQSESDRVDDLTKKIDTFLGGDHATPEQVKEVAQECLNSEMTMDAEEIKSLADQINAATDSVKNVDRINEETAAPLVLAKSLKQSADQAKEAAAAQLARAERVTKSLGDAEDAQSAAEAAIETAMKDISDARVDLGFIESEMQEATRVSNDTVDGTTELLKKKEALQTAYIYNENQVKKAQLAAQGAKDQASKANSDLYALNTKYRTVSSDLTDKENKIGSAKDQALGLQRRANALSNSASQKLANLLDMEKQYEDNQKELEELSDILIHMNCQMQIHLKVIQSKSAWYTSCTPPNTWRHEEDCTCPPGKQEPECKV